MSIFGQDICSIVDKALHCEWFPLFSLLLSSLFVTIILKNSKLACSPKGLKANKRFHFKQKYSAYIYISLYIILYKYSPYFSYSANCHAIKVTAVNVRNAN